MQYGSDLDFDGLRVKVLFRQRDRVGCGLIVCRRERGVQAAFRGRHDGNSMGFSHSQARPRMAIRSTGFYSKSGGLFPRMREVVTEKKEVGSS